jgi:hypothetical protein
METFQIVVLVVAAIVLIGSLTWFGITIRKTTTVKTSAYPPTFSSCPDYWEKNGNVCVVPVSRNKPVHDIVSVAGGITSEGEGDAASRYYSSNPGYTPGFIRGAGGEPDSVNFSAPEWKTYGLKSANSSDECIYKEWATRAGVTWDGITNYNQCA